MEQKQSADKRSTKELLAEYKKLSEQAEKIRKRLDEVTEEIARRAVAMEKRRYALTPPPWDIEPNPPKL